MINNAHYWDKLYKKYTTKYGDDHTTLVSALISENINDWEKTKLVDIHTAYPLILQLENANDHANALMLRTIYEIMEHSPTNVHRLGIRCGDISASARLEVINGSDELNALLRINSHYNTDLITSICRESTIESAYETLAYVMNTKNNELHLYNQDLTYKILFQILFIKWITLNVLMDPELESQIVITLFKNINTLCQEQVKHWLQNIDLVCETEEHKWAFLIGWHTLSLSPLLHGIDKNDIVYLTEVTKLVHEQIESEFNVDISKLNILKTLFDLTNMQLHNKKLEFFNTLKVEQCDLPEIS